MLPLIELKLTAVASPFKSPFTGEWTCNGHDVALRIEELRSRSVALHLNLDQFLSHHLVGGFTTNHVKQPILVWFSLRFDCVILSFSDKRQRYCAEWASGIPGYFESGIEAISNTAHPYAYWSGQNLHRLYPATSMIPFPDPDDGTPQKATDETDFVCDFGTLFGWTVGPVDPDVAEGIRNGNEDSWEYSIVPHDPEEIVRIKDLRCVLLHSRYSMST